MLLEREHAPEIDIVSRSFVYVSYVESSSNDENSQIFEGSCSKSISEYESKISGTSTSNYSDYVALYSP